MNTPKEYTSNETNNGTSGEQPTRHLVYWFEDGQLVIQPRQVENTLYRVHQSLLRRESRLFDNCLSIPDGKGEGEGTEAKPLKFFSMATEGFELFLDMLYPAVPITDDNGDVIMPSAPTPSSLELRFHRLLTACDHLDAARGKAIAVEGLRSLNLSAPRRLLYAKMFTLEPVDDWVTMPARELFGRPIRSLSTADHSDLSYSVLNMLACRREEYRDFRELVAIRVPSRDNHHDSCINHNACVAAWSALWNGTVVKLLFHPSTFQRVELNYELKEKLTSIATPTGMIQACKVHKIEKMEEQKLFEKESLYRDAFATDVATSFRQML
ncbi:hypothetical protein C8J56DRAFT_890156 [Mycena floridula]|nr:hypothetical protein C8J56DRAFT_890156 [Mycena floridula]